MVQTQIRFNKPVPKHFEVKGTTGEELLAALENHGHAGSFKPYVQLAVAPSKEAIEVVKIGCDPIMMLPQWKGVSKADPQLKKGWQKTVALAKNHEMAHFKDFKARFKDLVKAIGEAETLDEKGLRKLFLDYRLQGIADKHELHEKRLDRDWKKIKKFLTGK
ncbi:MAG: DUF922 domain-containing protein [Pseudomonadota bacterium]